MKVEVFCAWGEAHDVGINITLTDAELYRIIGGHAVEREALVPVDLTAQAARAMAAELIAAAEQAEQLERDLAAYCKEHSGE